MLASLTLKHLKVTSCPVCQAGIKSVTAESMHTNGEQFESVRFECGAGIKYVPNFSQSKVDGKCPHAHHIAIRLKEHLRQITECVNVGERPMTIAQAGLDIKPNPQDQWE